MRNFKLLIFASFLLNSCTSEQKANTMNISKILKIPDVEEYNKQLDAYLKTTDTIDDAVTDRFWEAYHFGTEVPEQWLGKKLDIIESEIENGKTYHIKNTKEDIDVNSILDFKQWVSKTYPQIAK